MDKKQEVIEILFDLAGECYGLGKRGKVPLLRSDIVVEYNRIAPLMQREFPKKEFEALLLRFSGMDIASSWLEDCERIWKGQEGVGIYDPVEDVWVPQPQGDNILEQDSPRGTKVEVERRNEERRVGKGRRGYDSIYGTFAGSPYSRRSGGRRKAPPLGGTSPAGSGAG